ncbi:MAG: hypothetical protein K0Q66_895 [Chitinophagaceae bacterium]|jgi:hypothetical protein|nr:hypothetical protein [Chitinophagaceae bacterium]
MKYQFFQRDLPDLRNQLKKEEVKYLAAIERSDSGSLIKIKERMIILQDQLQRARTGYNGL